MPKINGYLKVSVFLACPKIPFFNYCLIKICTSYTISKFPSIKKIKIPWFFGPTLLALVSPKL